MNKVELRNAIVEIFNRKVIPKFLEKNNSYGSEKENAFYNFEQTGIRLSTNPDINLDELDKRLLPLFAYMDKHQVALMQHLSHTAEFSERMVDNIVYGFIALAMYDHWKNDGNMEN